MIRISDYPSYQNLFQRMNQTTQTQVQNGSSAQNPSSVQNSAGTQNTSAAGNTTETGNTRKPDTTPSYRFAEPLRPLVPKEYSRIYSRSDVAEQGVVKTPARTPDLEDFSLTPVGKYESPQETASITSAPAASASEITDAQMDRFLRRAFKVFDLE